MYTTKAVGQINKTNRIADKRKTYVPYIFH